MKFKRVSNTLLLSLLLFLSCSKKEFPEKNFISTLWPDSDSEVSTERHLPSRGDTVIRITDINVPRMTIFPAPGSPSPKPAILIFPGGAYQYLAYNKEGTALARWLNTNGITGIVVKYTTPGDREAAFRDAQRAIRLVRQHADSWNIDPDRVGVMGFSAGGHLSVRLSNSTGIESYPAIDEADSFSTRPDFSIHIYPAYLDSKEHEGELTGEIRVSSDTPPTFMAQSKNDTSYVAGTIIYDRVLKENGLSSTFYLFEKGGHGFGLHPSDPEAARWPELCLEWLKEIGILD